MPECTTLRVVLKKKGMSQRQLADLLGVGEGNLSNMIRGERDLSSERRAKIAEVLQYDENELFPEFPPTEVTGSQSCLFLPESLFVLRPPRRSLRIQFQVTEGVVWCGLNGFVPSAKTRQGFKIESSMGIQTWQVQQSVSFIKESSRASLTYAWF